MSQNVIRLLLVSALLVSANGLAQNLAEFRVNQADIDADRNHWRGQGLALPNSGLVLAAPFAKPYTKRSFLVPAHWHLSRPEHVKASELAQDLEILEALFAGAYGGYNVARARGFDFKQFFSDWRQLLRNVGNESLPVRSAFAPLAQFLNFQTDNLLGVAYAAMGSGSRTAVLAKKPDGRCTKMRTEDEVWNLDHTDPAQQVKTIRRMGASGKLETAYAFSYPATRGRITEILCADKRIKASPTWKSATADRKSRFQTAIAPLHKLKSPQTSFRKEKEDIAIVAVPSFGNAPTATLMPLMEASTDLGSEKVLIVDLRMNPGGAPDLGFVGPWARGQKPLPFPLGHEHWRESCISTALKAGYAVRSTVEMPSPLPSWVRSSLQKVFDDLLTKGEGKCEITARQAKGRFPLAQRKWSPALRGDNPLIMVLVDNFTAAEAESAVHALATMPSTVIVGTNTFGAVQYNQPGFFVLPRTKVPMRMPMGWVDVYGDGRSVDGYGLTVDIVLDDERSNQPASILKLARLLLDEKN